MCKKLHDKCATYVIFLFDLGIFVFKISDIFLDYGRCVPKRVFELIATIKAAVDQVEQDNSTISIKLLKYIQKIDSLKEVAIKLFIIL